MFIRTMILTGIIFFFSVQLSTAAELKIGFVNALKIFESTKLGKKSKATLEDYIGARQKIITQEEEEIKKLEEEITKQSAVLSPEAKKEKEGQFQKKLVQYQKKGSELNKEIQDKKSEIIHDFNRTMEEAVKKVSEKEGYQMVLDKNPDIGTIVYATGSMDITAKVIEELDKQK